MDEWVEALKTAIAGQLANASHSKGPASRVDPARNASILQALRDASPANNVCVDCGSPAPEWAAINHGVLMCIECSGCAHSLSPFRVTYGRLQRASLARHAHIEGEVVYTRPLVRRLLRESRVTHVGAGTRSLWR